MNRMRRWLERRGWNVFAVTLTPSDGTVSLGQLAEQLASYIVENFAADCKIDIDRYSMGGLVCRDYVQRLNGAARVDRLITISTPHHGTRLAYLSRWKLPRRTVSHSFNFQARVAFPSGAIVAVIS